MYHVGRCGSTVIGQLLDQHSSIFWDGEIYFQKYQESNYEFRNFSNTRFLRRRMLASGDRYYGFEIKFLNSLHLAIIQSSLEEAVIDFVKAGVTKHLVLERQNYLRMLISWVVGRQRNQHHINRDEIAALTRVHLDTTSLSFGTLARPKSLLDWFQTIEHAYRHLRHLLAEFEVLDLTYEADIKSDPRRAYQRVCKFLGVTEDNSMPTLSRTNPFRVSEMLENFEEVATALQSTPYEWMLNN